MKPPNGPDSAGGHGIDDQCLRKVLDVLDGRSAALASVEELNAAVMRALPASAHRDMAVAALNEIRVLRHSNAKKLWDLKVRSAHVRSELWRRSVPLAGTSGPRR